MFEPEFNLLGGDALELGSELLQTLRIWIALCVEGGLENVELLRGTTGAVVLGFELTEAGEVFAPVLEPL